MNNQRTVIYKKRVDVLEGKNVKDNIMEMLSEVVKDAIFDIAPEKVYSEEWNWDGLNQRLSSGFGIDYSADPKKIDMAVITREILEEDVYNRLKEEYEKKEKALGSELMREIERNILLQVVDTKWREHLYMMDQLKEGIGLQAYAQKDPLLMYKKEGFQLFQQMVVEMETETVEFLFRVQVASEEQLQRRQFANEMKESRPMFTMPQAADAPKALEDREMYANSPDGAPKVETYKRDQPKIGRNDPCPCGSGKKYKKCCGKNA
jgi:preprotein translocase subunit SecA